MKKIFILLTAVAMITTTACEDFLTINPVSTVSQADLLNEEGLDWAVTAMYSTLYGGTYSSVHSSAISDIIGADAHKGSTIADNGDLNALELFTFIGTNAALNGSWTNEYNGIFRANMILDMLSKMPDLDPVKAEQIEGQALFFRGLYYISLVKTFGAAVPFVDLEAYQSAADPKVSNYDFDADEYIYIWDKIIADFDAAASKLPDVWTNGEIGRPNKSAALALKAMTLVYQSSKYDGKNGTQNRWNEALEVLRGLIPEEGGNGKTSNGLTYALHPSYGELYDASTSDNTSENVFEIQQVLIGSSTSGNITWSASGRFYTNKVLGGWDFWKPTHDLAQSYLVDAKGLPYLDYSYRELSDQSKINGTDVDVDLSMVVDPRMDINIGRFRTPFLDWDVPSKWGGYSRDVSNGGWYIQKKNASKMADMGSLAATGRDGGSTTKNMHLIRYAELLLWYAEALIETSNGDAAKLEKARTYVNMVRSRAGHDVTGYVKSAKVELADGTLGYDNLRGNVVDVESAYKYIFVDESGTETIIGENAAANYKIGLWPASQFATVEGATKALRAEFRAELALEGKRWHNLARWGIADEVLNTYAPYETFMVGKMSAAKYPEGCVYMPIPSNEITTMAGLLVQNEYWR